MADFFDDIVDSLFGGSDDSAQRAQAAANALARGDVQTSIGQGRQDVLNAIPLGQEAQRTSFQAALDLLGQSIPQQANVLQQGNIAAQNALLGNPQAVSLQPDFGFTDQTLGGIRAPQLQQLLLQALGGAPNNDNFGPFLGGGASPFFSGGAPSPLTTGGGSSGGPGIGSLINLASGPVLNALGIPTPTSLLTSALGGLFGGSVPAGALASGIGGSAIAAPSLGALSASGFGGAGTAAGTAAGGLGSLAAIAGPAAIILGGLALGNKIREDKPINMDRGNALAAQFQNAISPGGNLAGFLQGAIGPGDLENFDIMARGGGATNLGQRLPPLNAFQQQEFARLRPQFIEALDRKARETEFAGMGI